MSPGAQASRRPSGNCHSLLLSPTPLPAAHSAGITTLRGGITCGHCVGNALRLFLLGLRSLKHAVTLPAGAPTGFFAALQRAPGMRRRSRWLPNRFDDTLLP